MRGFRRPFYFYSSIDPFLLSGIIRSEIKLSHLLYIVGWSGVFQTLWIVKAFNKLIVIGRRYTWVMSAFLVCRLYLNWRFDKVTFMYCTLCIFRFVRLLVTLLDDDYLSLTNSLDKKSQHPNHSFWGIFNFYFIFR